MNLILAPIQGMTISFYRNLYSEIFNHIDQYYTPFITTTDPSKFSQALLKDILPQNNNKELSIIPQLLGNNGKDFNYYAKAITDLGYSEINWNIGCPYATVTKKKRGSGLLPYPDMIQQFLDLVCKEKEYELSIKMRTGLNDLEEGIEVMKVLNQYPIKNITLHSRTGVLKYTGTVNLDDFNTLSSMSNHKIIYNGDIYTLEDYQRIQAAFTSIDTFMLGRGALRNPFLPSEIKGVIYPEAEKRAMLKQFHDAIYTQYEMILSGEKHLCDRMKEFWSYMSYNYDCNEKLFKQLRKCRTTSVYNSIVNQILQ